MFQFRPQKPLHMINATAPIRICDNGGWTDTWFAGRGLIFNIGVSPYAEVQIAVWPGEGKGEHDVGEGDRRPEDHLVPLVAGDVDHLGRDPLTIGEGGRVEGDGDGRARPASAAPPPVEHPQVQRRAQQRPLRPHRFPP